MKGAPHSPTATKSASKPGLSPRSITPKFIERVRALILDNRPVSRSLPDSVRVHLDRQLPFLFVYRHPRGRDDLGSDRLLVGEAAYVTSSAERAPQENVRDLVEAISQVGVDLFGGFLIVELWASDDSPDAAPPQADFRVHEQGLAELEPTIAAFIDELRTVRVRRKAPVVEQVVDRRTGPPGRLALNSPPIPGVYSIGIEIRPVYRAGPSGPLYPMVLRTLHRKFTVAMKKGAFRFARTLTTHRPKHFHALGRRVFVKSVWDVDRRLAEVSDSYDFLLSVSPINTSKAWAEFRRNGYEKAPRFLYPHLSITPSLLKRKLFAIPLERIEDPEIGLIFRQKQDEIDRQLTALLDRGTARFVHESVQLYGGAEPALVELAETLLDLTSPHSEDPRIGGRIGAEAFAARARAEIESFRKACPQVTSSVQIRDDINGLIVSRGNLLVPSDLSIPAYRMEALIQHEVGTHVLTYINGKSQPFKQLYLGLAGYDALQEGIAVLAEHLVGGLTAARLRLLAARVLAVRSLLDGAGFIDVFRALVRRHGFTSHTAFIITMRVFRGGGLTKDAAYLRGLASLLKYFRSGGEIQLLLVGKLASDHVPVVEELLRRRALKPAPLMPRYLALPEALKRLDAVKKGVAVTDLIPRRKKR